jgi:hypothetical protein
MPSSASASDRRPPSKGMVRRDQVCCLNLFAVSLRQSMSDAQYVMGCFNPIFQSLPNSVANIADSGSGKGERVVKEKVLTMRSLL